MKFTEKIRNLVGPASPLRNREFRLLWYSNGMWWQALTVEFMLFGWLALELTDSAWMVALLGFVRAAPLLCGMFTPVITDRFRRRDLLIVVQGTILASICVLAWLFVLGELKFWQLAVGSAINGACWTLDWPTRRAIYPDLIGRGKIIDAMLLDNVCVHVARCLGPLIGGVLMNYTGIGGAFVLTIVLLAGALALLTLLRTTSRAPLEPGREESSFRRMREGLRYLRRKPRIQGVLLVTLFMNMWVFPFLTLVPVFVRDVLHRGPLSLGIMTGSFGFGSLLGLAIVRWVRIYHGETRVFVLGSAACAAGVFCFSLSDFFALSIVLVTFAGAGLAGFSIMQSGIILSDSSDKMRGRTMAAAVLAIGGGPIGGLQSIGMVAVLGAPATVSIMSFFGLASVVGVGFLLPGFLKSGR